MSHKDKAVSEIIGTMLVFAILVSTVTAFELWYVPSTQTAFDEQFQVNSQSSLSSLISDLENPTLQTGQIVSQSIPMGIQGSLLTPSTQSSIYFQNSGFNATLSYEVGINYKLLENTVPTAITNKVVGTFPSINGRIPTQAAYDYLNGNIYVTDYGANAITEINVSTGKVINEYYAGMDPYGIVFANGLLYISNFFSYYSANGPYSTITVFNPVNNSVVQTINSQGNSQNLLYPSGMVAVPSSRTSTVDTALYVSGLSYSNGKYAPEMIKVSLTNYADIATVVSSSSIPKNLANYSGVSFPSPNGIINVSVDGGLYNYIWMTDYYQSAVTIYNMSSGAVHFIDSYISHPFSLVYDTNYEQVYITDSSGLLLKHPIAGKGHHHKIPPGQLKKARFGNVTVYNAAWTTKLPPSYFRNLTVSVGLPGAISLGPQTTSGQDIYVAGYNSTYNQTGQFWYSGIVAIDTASVYTDSASYNVSASSYNLNGANGFIQGPVYMFYLKNLPNGGGLVVVDNVSNNVLMLTNLNGKLIASYTWNSPFNSPSSIAYDSDQNLVVVGNSLSQNIAFISPVNQQILQVLPYAGENLSSVTYDPYNNLIYAANSGSNNVTVISPQTFKTVANIAIPSSTSGAYARPTFVTYDPTNGSVYVLAGNTSVVYQINDIILSANKVILPPVNGVSKTIPYAGAFSNNGTIFVAEYNVSNIAELNLTSDKVVMDFSVGLKPDALAYDSLSNTLYIGNFASNSVSAIDLNTFKISSFSVGADANPTAAVLDPGNGYLYISNAGSNNITLNNTYTSSTYNSIATGLHPSGMVYDPDNGLIYITNFGSNQVTVVNGGSTYFNFNPGKLLPVTYYGSGQIVSAGPTAYVTPVTFDLQDNMILSNYSASKYIIASANVPVSLNNNSGNVTVSAYILNLEGQSTSYSGTGSSAILLNLTNVIHNQYYIGERFTYYDLYGNGYPAMVTGIYLVDLNYTINSPYSQEINNILFKQYNYSSPGISFDWKFAKFPVFVKSTNSSIYITISTVMKVYSINFEYTNAAIVGV